MVTTATLIHLARRLALRQDEPVEWAKEFPDGPAVFVQTPERSLFVRSVDGWLQVEQAPWVAAVVVITREDVEAVSSRQRVFLVPGAGEPIDLGEPAAVAELGRRLRDGSLGPEAYAELLVECQWPMPGLRRPVPDPDRPPADLPVGAGERAKLQPLRMWDDEHGDRWVAFCAVRRDPETVAPGVEVTLWSVRVPPDGPATWVRRLL
jgi:hypothetical protein